MESVDWLDDELLLSNRSWVAENGSGGRLTWSGIKKLAAQVGIRVHGHFDGRPAEMDAKAARRAIEYIRSEIENVDAIVLVRDQDYFAARKKGLEQARDAADKVLPVVIGLAVVEREAWVISGFDPVDESEQSRLDSVRKEIGHDPRTSSHDLTACKDDGAKQSPKRVLRELTGGDPERQKRCWRTTPLQTLRERGGENGLASFLEDVRSKLGSMLGHVGPKAGT
jgi:hypothetical protein